MRRFTILFLSVLALILVIFMARINTASKYNLTIHYNKGSEDYTNEFEYLPGNSTIRYVNENGDSIYRSGSFWIERNHLTK